MLHQPLTSLDYLKSLLNKHGIQPSRAMGQNFLISPEVVEAIVTAAATGPKRITELGAGAGTVTQRLAGEGFSVRAIEKDEALAQIIPTVLPPKLREQVVVEAKDLREVAWEWLEPYQIVGNIPYNLSGLIVRRLTQLDPAPQAVFLLVQHEVGERIRAGAGDMSLVSLAVGLWGQAERLLRVPKNCFWPQPKVDSQLLILAPHPTLAPASQREAILQVARTFFQAKRKQMGGVAKASFQLSAQQIEEIFAAAGVATTQRPQELTIEQWQRFAQALLATK